MLNDPTPLAVKRGLEIHYWIQVENRYWDASPNGLDRIGHGQLRAVSRPQIMPGGHKRDVTMYNPLPEEALIVSVQLPSPLGSEGCAPERARAEGLTRKPPPGTLRPC